MAPEQWEGSEVDVQADIYAVGCILGEMLAGRMLVQGATVGELRRAHQGGQALAAGGGCRRPCVETAGGLPGGGAGSALPGLARRGGGPGVASTLSWPAGLRRRSRPPVR